MKKNRVSKPNTNDIITGGAKASDANDAIQQLKKGILKKVVSYCDKCGTKYTEKNVSVLQVTPVGATVVLECSKCGSKHMIMANVMADGIKAEKVHMFGDLSEQEFMHYFQKGKITYREVIQMAKTLQTPHITMGQILRASFKQPRE